MSADLTCLALAASLPVAAVGWMVGGVLDRAGAAPGQRHGIWEAAFWAAPLTAAAVLAAPRLPGEMLRGALRLRAGGGSAWGSAIAPIPWHGPSVAAIVLAIALGGAAWRLARLALRLRRLAQVHARANGVAASAAGLPVRLSEEVGSPLLAGLWRPEILLPVRYGAPEAAEAAGLVCRHEAAHARRGDNLRLLLEEVASAIFWFNPVLPAVRSRLSAAREEVCDGLAVAGLTPHERRLYARSLLDCLAARAFTLPATGLIGLNRRSTTMRIAAILTPKTHRRRTALAAGLLTALAASATAAVALAAAQTPGDKPAAKWGPLDVMADRVVSDSSHHTQLWIGNASLSGVTKETMNGLFIDGRPATEADLARLPQARFASIKATFNPNGHELDRLDAQTTSAPPN